MRQPPAELVVCAQNCQKTYGLFASIQLAQFAIESSWGSRCTGKYNFFGIKAKQGAVVWTHEYIDGKYTAVQQVFANYNCPQDAFDAHAELLTDPDGHYAKALPFLHQLEPYVQKIAPIYATDPNYAVNLLNLIHVNNLVQYDLNATGVQNA